jgi:hypothetical protein
LDSLDAGRLTDIERCVTEANYAVYRNVGTDLAILWKAVHRGLANRFRHQPSPVPQESDGVNPGTPHHLG